VTKLIYTLVAILVVAVPVVIYITQRPATAPRPEPAQLVSSGSEAAVPRHTKPNHGEFRDRFQPKPPTK
jgi:hypothetical protein